jgi:hypothetical protein
MRNELEGDIVRRCALIIVASMIVMAISAFFTGEIHSTSYKEEKLLISLTTPENVNRGQEFLVQCFIIGPVEPGISDVYWYERVLGQERLLAHPDHVGEASSYANEFSFSAPTQCVGAWLYFVSVVVFNVDKELIGQKENMITVNGWPFCGFDSFSRFRNGMKDGFSQCHS